MVSGARLVIESTTRLDRVPSAVIVDRTTPVKLPAIEASALHGLSEETYQNYQPGQRLADTLAKVQAIVRARRELGSATSE